MNSLITRSPASEAVARDSVSSKARDSSFAAARMGVWEFGRVGVGGNALDMRILIEPVEYTFDRAKASQKRHLSHAAAPPFGPRMMRILLTGSTG